MSDFISKYLSYLANLPLYWSERLFRKEEGVWVFGAWFGDRYSDNPKYLFEYVSNNHPGINAVWLTKKESVVEEIRKKGYKAYYLYSIDGFRYALRAKYLFFSHSVRSDLFPFMLSRHRYLIQLWHGTPIKKIHFDSFPDTRFRRLVRWAKGLLFPFLNEDYDMALALSQIDRKNFSSAFDMPLEKIVVTGYPRNDALFGKKCLRRRIIYLPTFRDSQGEKYDLFTTYGFNLGHLSAVLKTHRAEFYIKTHPVNSLSDQFVEALREFDNIHLLEADDIYQVLGRFDMLITDYSSIYIDYLLLGHPIIFAPFDIDSYKVNDREFYYDYDTVTPGPKCRNWPEVIKQIDRLLDDHRLYAEERSHIKAMFHQYADGDSCRRVVEAVMELSKVDG